MEIRRNNEKEERKNESERIRNVPETCNTTETDQEAQRREL